MKIKRSMVSIVAKAFSSFVLCWAGYSLLACSLHAQSPSASEVKPDYSHEAFVDEEDVTHINFENDGTSSRVTSARVRIQSGAGVQRFGVLTFPYESSTETVDIDYVRVRKRDSNTVLTPSDNVQDMPSEITRQAPFYSDLREKHVAVKGLGVGDVLEFQTHWRTTKPLAPGQFWFSFNFPRCHFSARGTPDQHSSRKGCEMEKRGRKTSHFRDRIPSNLHLDQLPAGAQIGGTGTQGSRASFLSSRTWQTSCPRNSAFYF